MTRLLLVLIPLALVAGISVLLWRWLRGTREPGQDAEASSAAGDWPLFVLPVPLALAALMALVGGQLWPLLGNALGYGLFLGGALLVRRARDPSELRRRWWSRDLGAGLIALGSGVAAWLGVGHHPAIGVAFGLVTLLGFHLVYGLDLGVPPALRRRLRTLGVHGEASLRDAERAIAAIEQASREIQQPELERRLTEIAALARRILQRVEEHPQDLRRARRFLGVYLDGVQRVVAGYAKTSGQVAAPELDRRFRAALETVEGAFREQLQVLLERDVEDLDLQIEVLTRQLKREGIL